MATTASLFTTYNSLVDGIYKNPEGVDFKLLVETMAALRAERLQDKNELTLELQMTWPLGQRVWAAYSAAKAAGVTGLPKIVWRGTKNSEHNPNYQGNVKMVLAEIQEASLAGAKSNPFGALAALRG